MDFPFRVRHCTEFQVWNVLSGLGFMAERRKIIANYEVIHKNIEERVREHPWIDTCIIFILYMLCIWYRYPGKKKDNEVCVSEDVGLKNLDFWRNRNVQVVQAK